MRKLNSLPPFWVDSLGTSLWAVIHTIPEALPPVFLFNRGVISMLSVHNLSKSYGVTPLFTNVTFNLNAGDKAGLVGPNGCGKTTLLRLINGEELADSGVVTFNPPGLIVGTLQQGYTFDPDITIADYTQQQSGDIDDLSDALGALSTALTAQPDVPSLHREYDRILARLSAAIDAASRTQPILASLGLGD